VDASEATPFVGRERELTVLRAMLADALAGRRRIALLAGEAGIGKTRLADELSTEAGRAGARVLWGRCWEDAGAPAFWPWVQIVRAYAASTPPDVLARETSGGGADIAQVIPELRERLPDLPAPPAIEPEHARFRFLDSTARFLEAAAARQPLVLVLDDLHWADGATLLLARFVARTLRDARLLLVGTHRPDEPPRDAALARDLAEFAREADVVALGGLGVAEVERYIEHAVGRAAQRDAAAAIHRRTAGNPLFVGELVRLLRADGPLDDRAQTDGTALPAGVAQTVLHRLGRMSPACRAALATAAVCGVEFDAGVVERAHHGPLPRPLADLLGEAAAERIVAGGHGGRHRFTHALLRDALYATLEPQVRTATHARIAALLAGDARADRHADEIAHHAALALPHGSRALAIDWGVRAAEQDAARLAFEDAGRRYDAVLAILCADPAADPHRECELLIAAATAWNHAGDIPAAQQRADAAVRVARQHAFHDALGRAAFVRAYFARTASGEPEVVTLLDEAIAGLGDADGTLRGRLQLSLANVLAWDDAAERRRTLADGAVAIARRSRDPHETAQALQDWHWALWGVDNLHDRIATAAEMTALAEACGDRKLRLDALSLRIPDLLESGDALAFESAVVAFASLADEIRDRLRSWHTGLYRSLRALLAGRLDEAERETLDAMAAGDRVSSEFALGYCGAQLFALRREQGRLAEIEPAARDLAARYPDNRGWRAALAFLCAEIGHDVEARAALEAVVAPGLERIPRDHNWLITVAFLSQAAAQLGDVARAAALYDLMLPFAERIVVVAPGIASTGSVAHNLAVLATALGRHDAAERHFEDALAANTRLGAVPFVAHTEREYAAMLDARDRRGDAARAADLRARAGATYERLGMTAWLDRLPRTAAAPPIAPAATRAANAFARDGEQWTLAYEGRTIRLRHGKGLGYLAELLRQPGRHVHVIDLAGGANVRENDAAARPDADARAAYRRRVEELRDALADAERCDDAVRAARIREELEVVGRELAAFYGVGGAARGRSQVERVRKAVTKCIREDIARIGRHHETLARHLDNAVRTGTFCVYLPERPVEWPG